MMTIIQLIVLIVGLIVYVVAKDAKVQDIGKIMFWVGLLAFLIGGKLPGLG